MNRDELVSQIRFLLKLQEDKDAIIDRQQESLDETSIRPMTVERKRSSYAGLLPTGRK